MTFEAAIAQFHDYLIIQRGYSPQTAQGYESDLRRFGEFMKRQGQSVPITQVRQADIISFLAYLSHPDDHKPPLQAISRARKLSSIKSLFVFLRKIKVIEVSPAEDIDTPKLPIKESEYLTVNEYRRLLSTIDRIAPPFFKLRDLAIFTLFLGTGVRVSELVSLTLGDINHENHTIKVHRKGNKEQVIPLSRGVRLPLYRYLKTRPKVDSSHVFVSKKYGGMKQNSVYCLSRKYLKLAGITKSKSGLHLYRHACLSALLAKNVNPVIIQAVAGHVCLNTTNRYLHLNQDQVKSALAKLKL